MNLIKYNTFAEKLADKLAELKEVKFSPFVYINNIPPTVERTIRIKTLPFSRKTTKIYGVIDYSRIRSGRNAFIIGQREFIVRTGKNIQILSFENIAEISGFEDPLEKMLRIKLVDGKIAEIDCDHFGWYIYSIIDYLICLQETS